MSSKDREKPTLPNLVLVDANNRLAGLACSIRSQQRKAVDVALINHLLRLGAKAERRAA